MIKKILKIVLVSVLILILLLTVTIVIGTVFRDEKLLSPWGTGFFVIASGSMEPNIPNGSIIIVTAVGKDEISEKDVITFFTGEGNNIVATHRVREIIVDGDEYVYITRGDVNDVDDSPLSYDRVIGRVSYVVPGSGFIFRWIGNAKYVGIAIIGVGVLLCCSGFVSAAKKKKKSVEKEIVSEGTDCEEAVKAVDSDESEVDLDTVLKEYYSSTEKGDLNTVLKEVDSDEINFK